MPTEATVPAPAWLTPGFALAICVVLVLAIALGDALTPANLVVPILYGVPLILCARLGSVRFLWILAAGLVSLTFVAYFWGPRASHVDHETIALLNRCLCALTTVAAAGLVHWRMASERVLEGQRDVLDKQNVELETANQELTAREEEIVRQNEELQSQTEELERQSEEMRITNEELANHEKTLEQLLELSRSLSAALGRDEMLKRICEALGVLTNGMASAILLRQGEQLSLPCYHGFGSNGAEAEIIPFAGSFTSLIMSLGQTGYLEDLTLRPDVHVPRPKAGEPFRSVIASPLRVRGQCVGTIEVYSTQKQLWNEAQVSMLESLAAQASISLQSAELVEAIRQERRRFEAAFRTVPFGLAVADDPAGETVRLNPAAAALFNVPLDENVGASTPTGARLRRYLFRQDRPVSQPELPLTRALQGEEVRSEELEAVFPDGKQVVLLASAAPIYDARGQTVGAVSAFADITTLKRLQRELELRRREAEEASVRKTRFLAAVSHDIRTPVNAINLMAEVIRRSAGNPALAAQIPDMAHRLQANALSLVELVSDVLDIAHFDSGKVEVQESEFVLADLITQECRQLQPLAEDKGLRLDVRLPDRPVWVRADRVKLGRIIGNLVGNAVKFTAQGTVEVTAALDPERRLRLGVEDTGVGIAAEQLPHIFDEFTQIHNPERDRNKGTGLGLAICKRLVEVMGGTLVAESKAGQGSSFTVILPASCVLLRLDPTPAPAPRLAALPAQTDGLANLRVLLVEDHHATRESAARILASEGASVQEAADGRSALTLLRQNAVDVLLLDMMLPDMDGREVLHQLRIDRPSGLRAVLVLTGDLTPERLEEVKQLGADAVIGKPVDIQQLVAALRSVQSGGRC
jgi:PAS domain S-box-containing protein